MWTKGAAVFPASKKSGLQGATQTCAFPHFPGLTHAFMAKWLFIVAGANEKTAELNNAALDGKRGSLCRSQAWEIQSGLGLGEVSRNSSSISFIKDYKSKARFSPY